MLVEQEAQMITWCWVW